MRVNWTNIGGWLSFLGVIIAVLLVVGAAVVGDMRFALLAVVVLCLVIVGLSFLVGPSVGATDK